MFFRSKTKVHETLYLLGTSPNPKRLTEPNTSVTRLRRSWQSFDSFESIIIGNCNLKGVTIWYSCWLWYCNMCASLINICLSVESRTSRRIRSLLMIRRGGVSSTAVDDYDQVTQRERLIICFWAVEIGELRVIRGLSSRGGLGPRLAVVRTRASSSRRHCRHCGLVDPGMSAVGSPLVSPFYRFSKARARRKECGYTDLAYALWYHLSTPETPLAVWATHNNIRCFWENLHFGDEVLRCTSRWHLVSLQLSWFLELIFDVCRYS